MHKGFRVSPMQSFPHDWHVIRETIPSGRRTEGVLHSPPPHREFLKTCYKIDKKICIKLFSIICFYLLWILVLKDLGLKLIFNSFLRHFRTPIRWRSQFFLTFSPHFCIRQWFYSIPHSLTAFRVGKWPKWEFHRDDRRGDFALAALYFHWWYICNSQWEINLTQAAFTYY